MIPHYAVGERRDAERSRQGLAAAGFGILVNLGLIVLKGTIGVLGHSQALIADAVHSGADLLNSCIAAASFLYSRRPADWNHPYGHERAEAFASTVAAVLIAVAGIGVGYESLIALLARHPETPSALTFLAAAVAIVVKIGMSSYVGKLAQRIHSKSLLAEARDHLVDVIASVLVIVGIAQARWGLPWFDAVAGLGVAGFILITAGGILRDAAGELLDTSLSPEQRRRIMAVVEAIPGVVRVPGIAGRTIGYSILVELHVDVDPKLTVGEGAHIVDAIKGGVLVGVDDVRTVVVEINTDQFEPDALHQLPPGPAR